jgi:hypothetical protein
MTPNPLIDLAQDPVAAFAALGYLFLLFAILGVGFYHALDGLVFVYTDWTQNRERKKWRRLFGDGWGYIPTGGVALRLFITLLEITLTMWAVSALLWFAGISGV